MSVLRQVVQLVSRDDEVRQTALAHYLQRVEAATADHTRLRHYFVSVRPSCLTPDGYGLAAYIIEVRERLRRIGLAELRSGVHWGLEERERLLGAAMRPSRANRRGLSA